MPGCNVYFGRAFRNFVWEQYTDSRQARSGRRIWLAYACTIATHEEGHNLGLDHIPDTIMDADSEGTPTPRECRAWARSKLPDRAPRTN